MRNLKTIIGLVTIGLSTALMAAEKPKITPEQEAMMAKHQQYNTPGAEHKVLEPLIRNFTFVTRHFAKPGDKPMEATGASENTWVYGGRFVKHNFKMAMGNETMEGVGYTGYDLYRKEYEQIWLGDMGTGLMRGAGSFDAASKTITIAGDFSCPMADDKAKTYRSQWKIVSPDKHVLSMYTTDEAGKEFLIVEETYTRKK